MKKRNVSIVPNKLKFGQLLIQINIIAKYPQMQFLCHRLIIFTNLLRFKRCHHLPTIPLRVGSMFQLECFVNDVVVGIE
jgi:hypothetical protein